MDVVINMKDFCLAISVDPHTIGVHFKKTNFLQTPKVVLAQGCGQESQFSPDSKVILAQGCGQEGQFSPDSKSHLGPRLRPRKPIFVRP